MSKLADILFKPIGIVVSADKVFSCKLQGKRAKKTKEMIKELIKDDSEL